MRAAVLTAANAPLEFSTSHPEPGAPDQPTGEGLILDVTACGVCHSDIHVADGDFGKAPPIVLGHEVTGTHPEMGPVMLYAPWGCGDCLECGQQMEMICSNSTEAGLFTDGGYAERMWIPGPDYLEPLGDLDPWDAAPLACGGLTAWRAVHRGLGRLQERGSNARALVIGAGGLGQYAISYLRLLSDAQITAVDLNGAKQQTALDMGAHAATGTADGLGHFDLIIDFIGAAATLETGARHINKLGTVVVVGLAGGTIPFGFGAVPLEAAFVASVWGTRQEMRDLLDFARREPSVVRPVEVLPLDQANHAHHQLRRGDVKGRIVLDVAGGRTSNP